MLFPISRNKRVARISHTSARQPDRVRVLILASWEKFARFKRRQNTCVALMNLIGSCEMLTTHDWFVSVTLNVAVFFLKRTRAFIRDVMADSCGHRETHRIRVYVRSGAINYEVVLNSFLDYEKWHTASYVSGVSEYIGEASVHILSSKSLTDEELKQTAFNVFSIATSKTHTIISWRIIWMIGNVSTPSNDRKW